MKETLICIVIVNLHLSERSGMYREFIQIRSKEGITSVFTLKG